jgi:hypothetical protein
MPFEITAEKLLPVLHVIDLVPNAPGFPSSTFVRLRFVEHKLSLGLSAELHGSVSVESQGDLKLDKDIFCDRNLLFPFLFAAEALKSQKPFVFTFSDGQLQVTHGRRKGVFDCADRGAGYHVFPSKSKGTPLAIPEKTLAALQSAASCATADMSVPELACVYIRRNSDTLAFYGSNQLLALRTQEKAKIQTPGALAMPLLIVPHLKAEGLKEVRLHDTEIALHFDCGVLWYPISVKAQKGFPYETIDKLLEAAKKYPTLFSLQIKRLETVVGRFNLYLASAKKQDWLLRIKGNKGDKQILLEVKIPQGVFHERITVEEPLDKAVEIDWPLDVLLPVFSQLFKREDSVLQVRCGEDTPYLLSVDGCSVVVTRRK